MEETTISISNKEYKCPPPGGQPCAVGIEEQLAWLGLNTQFAREACYVESLDRNIFGWNAGAEALYGYLLEEVIGKPTAILNAPEVSGDAMSLGPDPISRRLKFSERDHIAKDGRMIHVVTESHPLTGLGGSLIGRLTLVREKRRTSGSAEMKRAQDVRAIAVAVERSREGIVTTDLEGLIQYVNPAYERITGYTAEELKGQRIGILDSGRHTPEFYHNLWETIRGGSVWSGRFINRRKDGSLYQEDATICPVFDSEGALCGYASVKRDVTEELDRESQLIQAKKLEGLGLRTAEVAHDFNNLLTVIAGQADLLQKRLDANNPAWGSAGEIRNAAETAMSLCRDLLSFGRRQRISAYKTDVNQLIEDFMGIIGNLAGEGVVIQTSLDESCANVGVESGELKQVLLNLVSNARDAMKHSGEIKISTRNVVVNAPDVNEEVRAGRYVVLAVEDTGSGIDDEIQGKIFDRFFTTKPMEQGTGLGLWTVRSIATKAGGAVEFRSIKGQGSTFEVFLPALDGAEMF